MSLLDNVRQSLGNAASTALEVSHNLGAQAQAQISIKRLQVEHAKKLHELGVKTYEWHKSGTLIAAGPVPREVHATCHQLDDINVRLEEQNRKLEEARREAELRAAKTAPDDTNTIGALTPNAPNAPNRNTQILGDPMQNDQNIGIPGGPILGGTQGVGPDINQPGIPVPGPDLPPTGPESPHSPVPGVPSNPDLPAPSQPTMPGMPSPSQPTMPGGPSFPTM